MEIEMHSLQLRTALLANAVAAALLVSVATAHAANDQGAKLTQSQRAALQSHIDACQKLPANKRDSCADRARHDFARMDPSLTSSQKAALERDGARYESAVNACNKLPLSERNTCESEAGLDLRLARAQ